MASARYRNFTRLLEKWPINESRGDRDLGLIIRKRVGEAFSKGPASVIPQEAQCDKELESLNKILNNASQKKWARSRVTNATGHIAEDLNDTLSEEGLQAAAREAGGLKAKMKEKIFGKK